MRYIIPDYYQEFTCIADRCTDTCCAGWQIMIDDRSYRKYRRMRGAYAKTLKQSVDWKQHCFRQTGDLRCAFLNEDNLCEMYRNLGPQSLCKTCHNYPQHIEEFENVRRISLSVSCPEVARMLVEREDAITYREYEREGTEEYEFFDYILYDQLVAGRKVMIEQLQDRSLPLVVRCGLVLGLAHDMHIRIGKGRAVTCPELFDRYRQPLVIRLVTGRLGRRASFYERSQELMQELKSLERLQPAWGWLLEEAQRNLYSSGQEEYDRLHREFEQWWKAEFAHLGIVLEHLLVYFLDTYFCGAVYDEEVYAMTQFGMQQAVMIYELWLAAWIRNGRTLDREDLTEIIYRYSREIEHSDVNIRELEEFAWEHPWIPFVKKKKGE